MATTGSPVAFWCAHYGEPEVGTPARAAPIATEFNREQVRLMADQLAETAENLKTSNARLRALINIGVALASEQDVDRLLQGVCVAARDLSAASYVTLGILDLKDRTVERFVTCGVAAAGWIKTGDAVSGVLGAVVAERRTARGQKTDDPAAGQFPPFHPEVQAFLVVPIASPAHVYGWICVVGNEGRTFTENDEHLVRALAGLVGRIYENGHLAIVAEKRAVELEHQVIERQQAELALRHERDRAQRYLDTAEVMLIALDKAGRITLANRYACAVLGWTADQLHGRDWIETCLPPGIRASWRHKLHDLVDGNLPRGENPVLTRSGEVRLIEWRHTVLRDEAGLAIGTFSSGADITERNQAVEALRVAEERMRFALDAAGVGIWDMNFKTGKLQWSAILESQYGLPAGTFGGTSEAFVERVHPLDRHALRKAMEAATRKGTDFSVRHRTLWPDGTVRWLNAAGRIRLGEHGEPVRGVGISQDITDHCTLEEQFQQAQKMEAVGRVVGGVAHDFNNLLTVIMGYCELSLDDLEPGNARRADLAEIQKTSARAAALTSQLLAFSRKEIIEPKRLDLNGVIAGMRAMLGLLIRENVTVVMDLEPALGHVTADRGQMEQIVMNLAVNARDAMPKGGTLTLATANVKIDSAGQARLHLAPGPYVVFTVTDTGTGITPEVQARLFEPFFTTKDVGTGTGLGLTTVHGIVTRGGGGIQVDTEIGRGTSFRVFIPESDAAEAAAEVPPVARPPAGTQTVLVVDDSPGLCELARRLLARQGYTVLVAANVAAALEQFDRHRSIDVLLTDVVMPGASGPELTRQLIERCPDLRVIYMSGYTEDTIGHHGGLGPGVAFLHKPFTSETLGEKIREVLNR